MGNSSEEDGMAAASPQEPMATGPARDVGWLIAPPLPEGTTIELATTIRADGLTPEAFGLLARLAGARRQAEVTPSCPMLTKCDVFHDHGQTCPVLTICGTNVALARAESS